MLLTNLDTYFKIIVGDFLCDASKIFRTPKHLSVDNLCVGDSNYVVSFVCRDRLK